MVCWWNAFMHDITDYLRSQIADLTQVVLESLHSTHLYLLDVRDTKRELALSPVLHKMAQHHRGSLRLTNWPSAIPSAYKMATAEESRPYII